MILVNRCHASFDAAGRDEKQSFDPTLVEDGQHLRVVLLQPIVERQQTEVPRRTIPAGQEFESGFERGHLVFARQVTHLTDERVERQRAHARERVATRIAHVVIHHGRQL